MGRWEAAGAKLPGKQALCKDSSYPSRGTASPGSNSSCPDPVEHRLMAALTCSQSRTSKKKTYKEITKASRKCHTSGSCDWLAPHPCDRETGRREDGGHLTVDVGAMGMQPSPLVSSL